MKYSENPTVDFSLEAKVETEDPACFVAFLQDIPADVPVAWYSHKDEGSHPGVWVRRGMYQLKHGSFVDPYELSAYAAQYYEASEAGRHEAVQIGRTPQHLTAPDGVCAVATVGELLEALLQLVPASAAVSAAEGQGGEGNIASSESKGDAAVPGDGECAGEDGSAPVAFQGSECASSLPMKYLQPDYAFEFHGALTRGWHAQLYVGEDSGDDAEQGAQLLVLR